MLITFICKRAHIQRYSLCCKLLWRCFDELLLHTQPTTIMFFMEATYVRLKDIVLWSVGVKNAVGIVVISHISISRLRTCSHPMSEQQRESEREREKGHGMASYQCELVMAYIIIAEKSHCFSFLLFSFAMIIVLTAYIIIRAHMNHFMLCAVCVFVRWRE